MLSRRLFAASAAAATGTPALLAAEARAQTAPADSTMDRMKSTKILRIAALPGEAPYFNKDLATGAWSGMCIDMAKDIAGNFDGTVEYIESTYGNSVLDLQSGGQAKPFTGNMRGGADSSRSKIELSRSCFGRGHKFGNGVEVFAWRGHQDARLCAEHRYR